MEVQGGRSPLAVCDSRHREAAVGEFEVTYGLFLLLVLAGSQGEQSRVRAGGLKPWTEMQI